MLCQEVTVWTKKTFTNGFLPTARTGAFHFAVVWDTVQMETLGSRQKNDDRSTSKTTSDLVLASHQETPRSEHLNPRL
jgi:hypothetical protein